MAEAAAVSILARFSKNAVNRDLGIAIGYAVVCEKRNADGKFEPYFDQDRDFPEHITPQCMVEAACDFALSDRVQGVMHKSADGTMAADPTEVERRGTVVHTFPMTQDIAEALEITVQKTGLLIAVKPDDPEVLGQIERGELNAFSIGGLREEGHFQKSKQRIRYVQADE